MKVNQKTRIGAKEVYYVCLGLLILGVVGGGAAYYWATGIIHDQTLQLREKMAVDAISDERVSQLIGLRAQYQKLEPLIPSIESALPPAKKQSEVALQLQQLATASGMTLPSVAFASGTGLPSSTSQTISAGGILALPVTFQLTGNYAQLQTFLVSLESLGRYASISGLDIGRADSKAHTLTYGLNINVFVKP